MKPAAAILLALLGLAASYHTALQVSDGLGKMGAASPGALAGLLVAAECAAFAVPFLFPRAGRKGLLYALGGFLLIVEIAGFVASRQMAIGSADSLANESQSIRASLRQSADSNRATAKELRAAASAQAASKFPDSRKTADAQLARAGELDRQAVELDMKASQIAPVTSTASVIGAAQFWFSLAGAVSLSAISVVFLSFSGQLVNESIAEKRDLTAKPVNRLELKKTIDSKQKKQRTDGKPKAEKRQRIEPKPIPQNVVSLGASVVLASAVDLPENWSEQRRAQWEKFRVYVSDPNRPLTFAAVEEGIASSRKTIQEFFRHAESVGILRKTETGAMARCA